jgi:mannosyltransferase OCH1-like enzyme
MGLKRDLTEYVKHTFPDFYWRKEKPLVDIGDRLVDVQTPNAIPNHLYQTWEDKQFGKTHAREIRKFRDLNPEISFHLFDQGQRDRYMQEQWGDHEIHAIYKTCLFGQGLADIFRFCIICERGGYYFDISKGCSVPLTSLHSPDSTALLTNETNSLNVIPDFDSFTRFAHPGHYFVNWGFGFTAHHPILRRQIENICRYYPYFKGKTFPVPKDGLLQLTGTGMWAKSIREVVKETPDVDFTQAGFDFNGHGIFELEGAHFRYVSRPAYSEMRDMVVFE